MNVLKSIFGRVMAFWALLVFTVTLFIFVIPIAVAGLWPEPKRSRIAYVFYSVWMRLFFILIGVRRRVIGREHFKKGQVYVVVCNHHSLMDPPLSSSSIPSANKTIAKAEMAKIPIFGIAYKRGSVLVNRKNEESRRAAFGLMRETLAQGLHMCIYPEGTRNKTDQPLQRFHDGAFRLAVETGTPLIPSLLFNTAKVLPRKPFFFWPTKVEMHFLPPMAVEGHTAESLKEAAFAQMERYYLQHK